MQTLGTSLFIVLFSYFATFQAQAKTIVISDIDDTIRQSNVLNKVSAAFKLLGTPDTFADLALVYSALEKQALNEGQPFKIAYISASLPMLYDAEKWVTKMGLPQGFVRQRQSLSEEKQDFKKAAIREFILREYQDGDMVLMFGDNAELDPTIYLESQKELGLEQSSAIFIHDVRVDATNYARFRRGERFAGIHYYFTPLDFMLHSAFESIQSITEDLIALTETQEQIPYYVLEKVSDEMGTCPTGKPLTQLECQKRLRMRARQWLSKKMGELITRIRAHRAESLAR